MRLLTSTRSTTLINHSSDAHRQASMMNGKKPVSHEGNTTGFPTSSTSRLAANLSSRHQQLTRPDRWYGRYLFVPVPPEKSRTPGHAILSQQDTTAPRRTISLAT